MQPHVFFCYGDSNTYGYDPRGFFGGRYANDNIWCTILEKSTNCRTINFGENGRMVPHTKWEYVQLERALTEAKDTDVLLIMLGSNDILLNHSSDIEETTGRMETLLRFLNETHKNIQPVLLAPPMVSLFEFEEVFTQLSALYEHLAKRMNIPFVDTQRFTIPLSFDSVHFTPEGHKAFALQLQNCLEKIFL